MGHLHQAVRIGGRLPAHQLEHQLAYGMQGYLVYLGRLGKQGEIEGALQQLAAQVLAGGGFEPHRETGARA